MPSSRATATRQGADRGRLVDDQQHRAVLAQPPVQLADLRLEARARMRTACGWSWCRAIARLCRFAAQGFGVARVAGEVGDLVAELFVARPAEPDGPDLA